LKGITGIPGAFPNLPGGDAANAQAKLNSLKSQVAANALQEMRAMSKTGGAVGQVTEKEWPRLESLVVALDNAQSYEAMQEALDNLAKAFEETKGRATASFNEKYNEGLAPSMPSTPSPGGSVAPFNDAEKERRYQEWKKSHK
jgi:hypothetical protein